MSFFVNKSPQYIEEITNGSNKMSNKYSVSPEDVHKVLSRTMLADGLDLVLDIKKSNNFRLYDARSNDMYIDFFSFFASSPLSMNHPKLSDPDFVEKLTEVAKHKPSNSDVYTVEMAEFVNTFEKIAKPDYMKYLFFISGGALAVENGLKVAFDWKVRKNFQKGYKEEKGHKVIHFKEAFHGRSGYTLSLTNTDPTKYEYFPKFDWPRIINPKIIWPLEENSQKVIETENEALRQIYKSINDNKDDIAVIIIEPIQAEGGENFFRKEFLQELRKIADENEILLMFDEVQTGIGLTGKMWAHQHYDIKPDIVSFGKKTQICGIMVSDRIDDIPDHCFRKSSRINSTWGGNLVDMVRSAKYLSIIEEENLVENAKITGNYLISELKNIQDEFPGLVSQVRGLGLMCSFDLPSKEIRNDFINKCYNEKLIILGCGTKSIRFRTPLDTNIEHIDCGLNIIKNILSSYIK